MTTAHGHGHVPLVLVLDLDGTIVGDVASQVCEYELLEATAAAAPIKKAFKTDLMDQLKETRLIRPGFRTFARGMSKRGVEMFVYTASDTKWANIIVPAIETVVGVRFNRPLFTRKQCQLVDGVLRKPVKAMIQSIYSCLRKRHRTLLHPSDLEGRLVFIDNSDVMLQDAAVTVPLLRCPTYAATHAYDVLRWVPTKTMRTAAETVGGVLKRYGMLAAGATSMRERGGREMLPPSLRELYYRTLSGMIRREHGAAAANERDRDRTWEGIARELLQWCQRGNVDAARLVRTAALIR